ncbi:MAG TPA: GGDEF domain-containing protein [Candidatus Levilactobacillus faecigallinarum]|uniref:GGDEF domain-containing protein n=1 Tax=Candidatus Levilactobacillus faecigallinarum TaxID=2838638 RepID=A0A9D1QRX6_9LACO|nr:GGDEF domain-containing protein [Candidatus Levilactobacillus faecigallinarum]
MTWSMWLVPPFVTSIFFVLGVITLYWSIFNWVTAKVESQKKPVDVKRVQVWIGAICAVVSTFGLQMLVRDSHLSWTFTTFQLLILIFVAYFLQVRIPYWLIVLASIGFMLMNGNILQPLSWLYTILFGLFYVVSYIQSVRMWPRPFIRYFVTALLFALVLWGIVTLRFDLAWTTYVEEIANYLILAALMYGYFNIQDRDRRIKDRLFQAANWDALTRVKNYAAYDREIGYQFYHSVSRHRNLSMIMFDIDHFKHVNDTYGHLAGDEVLKEVASTVTNLLKKQNEQITLYRTGGEEFNVILPDADLVEAQRIAKLIFDAVAEDQVDYNDIAIHVTLSIGVSALAVKDRNPLDFYKRVDANLYHSKKNGRMQITTD